MLQSSGSCKLLVETSSPLEFVACVHSSHMDVSQALALLLSLLLLSSLLFAVGCTTHDPAPSSAEVDPDSMLAEFRSAMVSAFAKVGSNFP